MDGRRERAAEPGRVRDEAVRQRVLSLRKKFENGWQDYTLRRIRRALNWEPPQILHVHFQVFRPWRRDGDLFIRDRVRQRECFGVQRNRRNERTLFMAGL